MKLKVERSKKLFEKAETVIAGGVSSTARGPFRFVIPGVHPVYIEKAFGSHIIDVDGNEYIDYLQHFGSVILGFAHPKVNKAVYEQLEKTGASCSGSLELEIEAAEKFVEAVPGADLMTFHNTGSDANNMALKIARGYTGKEKLVTFEGCFYGESDWAQVDSVYQVVMPGSRVELKHSPTQLPPTALRELGVPRSVLDEVIVLPWNDFESVEIHLERHANEIAAVIIDPVGPTGVIPPEKGFLEKVREVTKKNDILLIFDEIKTGFRLAHGGAQELYGVIPDLSSFGKSMANGFPVGAVGGKKDIMQLVSDRRVSHDGTFNANAVTSAAALATLTELEKPHVYEQIYKTAEKLTKGIRDAIEDTGIEALLMGEKVMAQPVFTDRTEIRNAREYPREYPHTVRASVFKLELLKRGIHARHRWCVSLSHSNKDVDKTIAAVEESLKEVKNQVPMPILPLSQSHQ